MDVTCHASFSSLSSIIYRSLLPRHLKSSRRLTYTRIQLLERQAEEHHRLEDENECETKKLPSQIDKRRQWRT